MPKEASQEPQEPYPLAPCGEGGGVIGQDPNFTFYREACNNGTGGCSLNRIYVTTVRGWSLDKTSHWTRGGVRLQLRDERTRDRPIGKISSLAISPLQVLQMRDTGSAILHSPDNLPFGELPTMEGTTKGCHGTSLRHLVYIAISALRSPDKRQMRLQQNFLCARHSRTK
jgi:hypothetical protein